MQLIIGADASTFKSFKYQSLCDKWVYDGKFCALTTGECEKLAKVLTWLHIAGKRQLEFGFRFTAFALAVAGLDSKTIPGFSNPIFRKRMQLQWQLEQ